MSTMLKKNVVRIVIADPFRVKLFACEISWFGINRPMLSKFINKDRLVLIINVENPTITLFFIIELKNIIRLKVKK